MAVLAADEALKVTLVSLAIWVVLFPVLVQGLIIYAVVLARGERRENEENRRHRGT
jgi:hypothetical protein